MLERIGHGVEDEYISHHPNIWLHTHGAVFIRASLLVDMAFGVLSKFERLGSFVLVRSSGVVRVGFGVGIGFGSRYQEYYC